MSSLALISEERLRRQVQDLERTVSELQTRHKESLKLLHGEIGRLQRACAADQLSELLIGLEPSRAETAAQTDHVDNTLEVVTSPLEQLLHANATSSGALSAFAAQSSQATTHFSTLFGRLTDQIKERDQVIEQLGECLKERDSQLAAMQAYVSKQTLEFEAVKQRLAQDEVQALKRRHSTTGLSIDKGAQTPVPMIRPSSQRVAQVQQGDTNGTSTNHGWQSAHVVNDDVPSSPCVASNPPRPPSAPLPQSARESLPQRPSGPPPSNMSLRHLQLSSPTALMRRPRSVASGSVIDLCNGQPTVILPLFQSGKATLGGLDRSDASPNFANRSQNPSAHMIPTRVDSVLHESHLGQLNKTAMLPPIGMGMISVTRPTGASVQVCHESPQTSPV